MTDLEKLILKIREGKIVLWAGAGFSYYAGAPRANELVNKIKELYLDKNSIANDKNDFLPDVAEALVKAKSGSRTDLFQILKNEYNKKFENHKLHKIVSDIPQIKTIITTNYDRLFEQAFEDKIDVIFNNASIPLSLNEFKVNLYKIHGDLVDPDSVIITSTDYNNFYKYKKDEPLWNEIKSIIAKYPILFIGYSFEDPNIKYLFENIFSYIGRYANESFFVVPQLPVNKQLELKKNHISYINMTAEEIMPIIYKEVRYYLIDDTQSGKIIPQKSIERLYQEGVDTEFTFSKTGKAKLTSLKPVKGSGQNMQIKFSIKESFYLENKSFFEGKKFGKLEVPLDKIINLNGSINNINLPFFNSDTLQEFALSSVPSKRYSANLILKKSNSIMEEVSVELFSSKKTLDIRMNHKLFQIQLIADETEAGINASLTYTIPPPPSISLGKKIFDFFNNWYKDETLIIEDLDNNNFYTFPARISDDDKKFKKSMAFKKKLFDMLMVIQKYFNEPIVLPDNLLKDDIDSIIKIHNLIVDKTIKINEISLSVNLLNDDEIKNVTNTNIQQLKMKLSKPIYIDFLERKIIVDTEYIVVKDAFVKNIESIKAALKKSNMNIKIIFGSKSGKAFLDYKELKFYE